MQRRDFLKTTAALSALLPLPALAAPAPGAAEAERLWGLLDGIAGEHPAQRGASALQVAEQVSALTVEAQAHPQVQAALMQALDWSGEGLLATRGLMAAIAGGAEVDEDVLQEGLAAASALAAGGTRRERRRAAALRRKLSTPEQRVRYARQTVRAIDSLHARAQRLHRRELDFSEAFVIDARGSAAHPGLVPSQDAGVTVVRILGMLLAVLLIIAGLYIAFVGLIVGLIGEGFGDSEVSSLGAVVILLGAALIAGGIAIILAILRAQRARTGLRLNSVGLLVAG